MKLKYCIANWKMNMDRVQAIHYLKTISNLLHSETWLDSKVMMVICPPYTLLDFMLAMDDKCPLLGIQNFYPQNKGAYTGEISLSMIDSNKVGWGIIGHSERRSLFNESDEFINLKVRAAID